jgi:hypothetical protein
MGKIKKHMIKNKNNYSCKNKFIRQKYNWNGGKKIFKYNFCIAQGDKKKMHYAIHFIEF